MYAFDADSGNATPLWTVNLGTPVPSQDICVTDPVECPYTDVIPVIGILATPVIDPVSGTIYVVANTKDTSANYHFKLHALDLITGAEKFGGPTEITATGFTPFTQLNRPGLLLTNGTIYMGFGSVGDFPTWHGWVMAYDATTLQQVAAYNSTPQNNSVGGAGIWQTGNGLVADASGNIYAVTSNGNFDVDTGGKDFGSAYLKLSGSALVGIGLLCALQPVDAESGNRQCGFGFWGAAADTEHDSAGGRGEGRGFAGGGYDQHGQVHRNAKHQLAEHRGGDEPADFRVSGVLEQSESRAADLHVGAGGQRQGVEFQRPNFAAGHDAGHDEHVSRDDRVERSGGARRSRRTGTRRGRGFCGHRCRCPGYRIQDRCRESCMRWTPPA